MATYTSKADEEFFGAIGRLTISWAHLELGLDLIIDVLHRRKMSIEPQRPRALQRKINYLRAAVKRMGMPEPTASNFESLFSAIETAAETRHDIIHGAVVAAEEGGGEATFIRLLRQYEPPKQKVRKYSTIEILESAVFVTKLGGRLLSFGRGLQQTAAGLGPPDDEQNQ